MEHFLFGFAPLRFLLFVLLLFISCKSGPAPPPETYYVEQRVTRPRLPERPEIEVIDYVTEEEFAGSGDARHSQGSGNPVNEARQNKDKYTINPTRQTYQGGAVIYNYVEDRLYSVYLSTTNLCDIQFQPGEEIVSQPASGDTYTFQIARGVSYTDGRKREHIYIKPLEPYKETILHVNTTKRTYKFHLRSFKNTYMPVVRFRYPMEEMEAARREEAIKAGNIRLFGSLENLNFGYEILPHSIDRPLWAPSIAFTDGVKTYINFASARRASYRPVLFSFENDRRILVNYRVIGNYYIVDFVLDRAELALDINAGEMVTIKRIGG